MKKQPYRSHVGTNRLTLLVLALLVGLCLSAAASCGSSGPTQPEEIVLTLSDIDLDPPVLSVLSVAEVEGLDVSEAKRVVELFERTGTVTAIDLQPVLDALRLIDTEGVALKETHRFWSDTTQKALENYLEVGIPGEQR